MDRTRFCSPEKPDGLRVGELIHLQVEHAETIWRLFFTRWWISLSRTSFSCSDARSAV
jgi:hypothetical protein